MSAVSLILRPLSALLISVALVMLGNSLFTTFIGLRTDLEGYSTVVLGLMTSFYFLGFGLGTFRSDTLINRIGHIRAFAAFSAIAASTILAFPLLNNAAAWVLLRCLLGFTVAGMFMVAESWLNNRSTNQTRGTTLAVYVMVCYLGSSGGQYLINIGEISGSEAFMLAALLLALSAVPVAITRATHPDPVEAPPFGLKRLVSLAPTAVTGCVASGLILATLWGMGPLYAKAQGLSVGQISVFMSIATIGGLLFQIPAGRLSDRYDRRTVIIGMTCGTAICAVLLLTDFAGRGIWPFLLVGFFAGSASTLYPLCVAYANDYLDPQDVVSASGVLVLAWAIGATAGPLAASLLMSSLGASTVFLMPAVGGIAFLAFALYRKRIRTWAPTVEKDEFVPLPEVFATPVVTEIDPRAAVDEAYDMPGTRDHPLAADRPDTSNDTEPTDGARRDP